MKTLLDFAGRIELPDSVQVKLGVKPGDELVLEEENGKWFIKPAESCHGSRDSRRPDGTGDVAPFPEQLQTVRLPADAVADDLHCDNLQWEDLDYGPVPLTRAGQVSIRVAHRGKLKPMVHALDDE